uniref:pyridoxamine 5'-phosphate oxidase family protein n=1 Tax=Nonomuraea pusilla TaxID=46177 RepID=UPI0006E3396F|nr:pyridoxamine 5'-phosphate oxidase family protein [Nonomuraea pusilla]
MTSRALRDLSERDALRLLAGVPLGRIVFTRHALPAVRPVNHIVADGRIVIRSSSGTMLSDEVASPGAVVAFEADDLDTDLRLGWSVIVTGLAGVVEDPDQAARYKARLRPWLVGDMDQVIAIRPEIVTGFELVRTTG